MARLNWKRIKIWGAGTFLAFATAHSLWAVIEARRTGVYEARGGTVRLAEQPELYWYHVHQMTGCLIVIFGFAALMLIAAMLGQTRLERLRVYFEKRAHERHQGRGADIARDR